MTVAPTARRPDRVKVVRSTWRTVAAVQLVATMTGASGRGNSVVKPPKGRVFELDLLRFVAAVMVLLYHYTWRAQAIPDLDAPDYPTWINSWSRYGFLGVELFFFISGMVIFHSAANASARGFLLSRVVRLFPAYWVLVTFSFLLVRLAGNPGGLGVST